MFGGEMYDQDYMSCQLKRKRLQLLTLAPKLVDSKELRSFLLDSGNVGDIRNLPRDAIELKEGEELWSESSEGDSSDQGEDAVLDGELVEINKVNEGSLRSSNKEFTRRPTI